MEQYTPSILRSAAVSYTHLAVADVVVLVAEASSWEGTTPATTRNFTCNSRSELGEDRISQGGSFSYQYDNIGNRKTARELEEEVSYDAKMCIRDRVADCLGGL